MVTRTSATNLTKYENMCQTLPVEADHSGLVKFKHNHDPKYVNVRTRLSGLIGQAPSVIKRRFSNKQGLCLLYLCPSQTEKDGPDCDVTAKDKSCAPRETVRELLPSDTATLTGTDTNSKLEGNALL
jgi:hypothetical protein